MKKKKLVQLVQVQCVCVWCTFLSKLSFYLIRWGPFIGVLFHQLLFYHAVKTQDHSVVLSFGLISNSWIHSSNRCPRSLAVSYCYSLATGVNGVLAPARNLVGNCSWSLTTGVAPHTDSTPHKHLTLETGYIPFINKIKQIKAISLQLKKIKMIHDK